MPTLAHRIATELAVVPARVEAAVRLLDEGSTVPFIARYRKEATGGLDDTQLRTLAERLVYLRELEERREAIVASIREQGKLTPALERSIADATTKTALEDLYLPYKPKRRTKAQIAREAGLEPLADALLSDPTQVPDEVAAGYLNAEAGFADAKATLDGARQILMERFSEDAALLGTLRERVHRQGVLRARVVPDLKADQQTEAARFSDYFEHDEPLHAIPSHRALALLRGRSLGFLSLALDPEPQRAEGAPSEFETAVAARHGVESHGRAADRWLADTVRLAWRARILLHLELDLMAAMRAAAEDEAIRVFGMNLRDLLLAAPAGARATMGLDPGLRTGVKVAVVDATGKLLETATVYPHAPRHDRDGALARLADLARRHAVALVSIGNGTASRETDQLVGDLVRQHPELRLTKVTVSEAGASVYSASEVAAREFPELDVSLRGAVSIARRLQDPLAELVKIEPRAIGVGQYQHDVNPGKLARSLDATVEDCVNAVGVELNTASAALLTRVSGLNSSLAQRIVAHRDSHGPFPDRRALLDVPRLGEKAFEQAAGFLRIRDGRNPLDASAVHPEAYPVVERLLARTGRTLPQVIGDGAFLRRVALSELVDERFGAPTVRDILAELEKPGRDPRPEFRAAAFRDDVHELEDLRPGMELEGVVTNVTNFGAFVDVGVHQNGLVHISRLARRFVKDPREVVKAGDVVRVKVLEVDLRRRRASLTLRLDDPVPTPGAAPAGARGR
ncbi:MAG: Tex family protein [bacterium]